MFNSVTLSRERLQGLLEETIEMMVEYRDKHGCDEAEAIQETVSETVDGMDESVGLIDSGAISSTHEKYHQCSVLEISRSLKRTTTA